MDQFEFVAVACDLAIFQMFGFEIVELAGIVVVVVVDFFVVYLIVYVSNKAADAVADSIVY